MWEDQIYADLKWLGLDWSEPARRQSDHLNTYRQAIEKLWEMGVLYPCFCNRKDIAAAASAPQEGAPVIGPDGIVYPGTCRGLERSETIPEQAALRLDMDRALQRTGSPISWQETGDMNLKTTLQDTDITTQIGDIVLARRDIGASYHLSVVVDDAAQGITHVIRGRDLGPATAIHVILQRLLGLPTPVYHHHDLIRDDAGKRLAKRDDARALATYREAGKTPQDIRSMVGLPATV